MLCLHARGEDVGEGNYSRCFVKDFYEGQCSDLRTEIEHTGIMNQKCFVLKKRGIG